MPIRTLRSKLKNVKSSFRKFKILRKIFHTETSLDFSLFFATNPPWGYHMITSEVSRLGFVHETVLNIALTLLGILGQLEMFGKFRGFFFPKFSSIQRKCRSYRIRNLEIGMTQLPAFHEHLVKLVRSDC